MPKLSQIAAIINTEIQTNVLNTSRFQTAKYFEIADIVKDVKEDVEIFYPVIIDNDGECTSVIVDDTYPLQIYHRILSLSNEVYATDNYGDENQVLKETAKMSMVIISDRHVIQMSSEDLLSLIAVNLPGKLTGLQLLTNNLISANIYADGDCIIDNEEVYNREYNLGEYLLKPSSMMYALSYTIETVFDKKCFPNCEI
jgi:hypothetical protein